MYFIYKGWDGGSDSPRRQRAGKEWFFAEGYTGG